MRRTLLLLALLLPLALAARPVRADDPDGYDRILERFHERMKRPGLDDRVEALRLLDPDNSRSLPELLPLLSEHHWFLRGSAAEVLAKVTAEPLRAELRLRLLTHDDPLVREGIALAFALSPEKGDAEALVEALDDGAWEVRRTSAIALAGIVSRESIEALIAALRKETDPRVSVHLADTLRKITGRNFGRDAEAWHAFWEKHRDDPALAGLDEEKKTRELGGIPVETLTVPTRTPADGGKKPKEELEFFVLPPFGFDHDVYRPYLDELSRFGRVTYVNLPPVQELTGLSGYGEAIPTYPVKKLVKALEELRKELGKNRVVVLGEGASGWIAEAYAILHRDRTAGLVVLNGYVDSASYAAALGRLLRSRSESEHWLAETLTNQNDVPHDEAAYRVLTRIQITMDLDEPTDSRGYLLWKNARDPQGFATVPDIRLSPRTTFDTPALFYWGQQSHLTGLPEGQRLRVNFPNSILAPLLKSRGFGYVTEYDEFYRILEGFLDYYRLR